MSLFVCRINAFDGYFATMMVMKKKIIYNLFLESFNDDFDYGHCGVPLSVFESELQSIYRHHHIKALVCCP